ncbi:hypothetical protein HDV00_008340, partial [Rhizophlyctis rosea]
WFLDDNLAYQIYRTDTWSPQKRNYAYPSGEGQMGLGAAENDQGNGGQISLKWIGQKCLSTSEQ